MILKEYSNIKEMIEAVEESFREKVVDGWQEGKHYICQLDSDFISIRDKKEKWHSFVRCGFKIKIRMPI